MKRSHDKKVAIPLFFICLIYHYLSRTLSFFSRCHWLPPLLRIDAQAASGEAFLFSRPLAPLV